MVQIPQRVFFLFFKFKGDVNYRLQKERMKMTKVAIVS